MEYLAKITKVEKITSKQSWKYTFLDIQANQEDYFYHHKQIEYTSAIGRLNLYEDKTFKSFEQDLDNTLERLEVEAETKEIIEKVTNNLNQKKIKLSLDVQTLHKLHNQGFT
jgi:hypothetical protein